MPIDINLLRPERGGNPDLVRESQRRRYAPVEQVDLVMKLDVEWRSALTALELCQKEMNSLNSQIKDKMKAKQDAADLIARRKQLAQDEPNLKKEEIAKKEILEKELSKIGNIVADDVPIAKDEAENAIVKVWGERRMESELLHHHDLLWRIGGYEPEKGVAVAGHRAYFLTGPGVLLNQAVINFGIAFLTKKKYTVLQPPFFMNKDVMAGVAQLEQFDEELYKVIGEDEKYLIATSEQPLCGYHKGEWLQESELPKRLAGYSTCFRKEAGAHGKDTWGIFRVHQFEKVEQFMITEPGKSKEAQEELLGTAEEYYQALKLPYHVVNIVSGDLNNAAAKKYDLEAWFPAFQEYRELVSCSNCTDYQSRAMEIRCGIKKMGQTEKKYVHMLNSTLCATTRTICCILENYQTKDGVMVPEVLVPFCGGITFFPFVREARENVQAKKMAKAEAKKGGNKPAEKPGKEGKQKKASSPVKASKPETAPVPPAIKSETATKPPASPKKTATGTKPSTSPKKTATNALSPKKTNGAGEAPTLSPQKASIPQVCATGIDKLEKELAAHSYVNGYTPSSADVSMFEHISGTKFDVEKYPNVQRWSTHISSFSETERQQWPAAKTTTLPASPPKKH